MWNLNSRDNTSTLLHARKHRSNMSRANLIKIAQVWRKHRKNHKVCYLDYKSETAYDQ